MNNLFLCIEKYGKSFDLLGTGWCRPDCNVNAGGCRTNSYWKQPLDYNKCMNYCINEASCVGFAIAHPSHNSYPGRCYVYGDISSDKHISTSKGWKRFPPGSPSRFFKVIKASGASGVRCFKRSGNYNNDKHSTL